jgi:alkylation response protein AidB-like acyl-CoA dehydrogenase
MSGGSLGQQKSLLRQLKQMAAEDERCGGQPLDKDPTFARRIAEIEMELRTLEAFNMRAIDKFSRDGELGGKALGAEANIFKIRSTEIQQRLTELKVEAINYYAMPYQIAALKHGWNEPAVGAEYANGCMPSYLHFRKVSIYSGSNEIQHGIIAKAQLGM